MKRIRSVSWIALLLTVLVMAVNWFLAPLPDWAVRADGILMLVALAATVFAMVRRSRESK